MVLPAIASVMEELGYKCSSSAQQFGALLNQYPEVNEDDYARMFGVIARTHTGLEDGFGLHNSFNNLIGHTLAQSISEAGPMSTWNLESVVTAIKQYVSPPQLERFLSSLICLTRVVSCA